MDDEQQRAIDAATHVLGQPLRDVTILSDDKRRNLILRAATPSGSVIVKATRDKDYSAHQLDAVEHGLVKEWVATAFLGDCAPGNAPAFLGGDAGRGLIVLADLGAGLNSLVQPLLTGAAHDAERALIQYAATIGRLHAGTLGCIDRHADYLRRYFPIAVVKPPVDGQRWREQVIGKIVPLLGGSVPEGEISAIAERIADPGCWLGLAHRDGCPDNVLLSDSGAHLVDFEFAGPGHVLADATYWHMGFPTCWCAGRVPDTVIAAMDWAYRAALTPALPIAGDDSIFRREMAILLFVRLFGGQGWLLERALTEDTTWGISTNRPRLLWHLDAAIAGAAGIPMLAGLRAAARRWRADLEERWPDAQPLALYPAFRA